MLVGKGKKLLVSCIAVCLICLIAIVGVSARVVIYDAECTSNTHSYNGTKQYYKVTAECKDFGIDRAVDTWTAKWYASGQGQGATVWGDKVTVSKTGNFKVYYHGQSHIGTDSFPCTATLFY